METNTSYKKRIGIFATVIILADYLIRMGVNVLISHYAASGFNSDIAEIERYEIINQIAGIGLSVLSTVIIFIVSYIFTKDKRKTVVFAGSIYFAKKAAGLFTSLISTVTDGLIYAGISASTRSAIILADDIIALPVVIALAYFAFTAFEGINAKLEGRSLDNSEMLLSQARKRYFAAYIISLVVTGVMTSGPSFVMAYLTSYGIIDNDGYSAVFTVIAQIVTWISSVIGFVILYCIGCKPYKNRIDGISFISVAGISGAITSLVTSPVFLAYRMVAIKFFEQAQASGSFNTYSVVASVGGTTLSVIGLVVEIAVILFVLKFFFSKVKINLFSEIAETTEENEAVAETAEEAEVTDTSGEEVSEATETCDE